MAELVSTVALSHAPGLTGWLDKAPEDQQQRLIAGYNELGELVRGFKPDYIIGIANDHGLNLPFNNLPSFCVGTAAEWSGPAEWFKDWVNVPDFKVKGNPDVARVLAREINRAGISIAFSDDLLFDDNWSVPLYYLTPEYDIPIIPIHMNCIVPPIPESDTCYQIGQVIADVIKNKLPKNDRVVFMATGGLSHDPGGPKYFQVDEEFDRWFLGLMELGDPQKVLKEATVERMMAAGDGGTSELLAWIAAMGAVENRPARTIVYEPAVELRCGMGCIAWDM